MTTIWSARCTAVAGVLSAASLVTACNPFAESDYANCVVAENVGSFTGERLQNDGNVVAARLFTTQCEDKDRAIDGGDGDRRGKVRWVVCLQGPDCDEAGMH